jgi:ATP-dependent RNA helicase DeaD
VEQLLGSAGVEADWTGPPSAEVIRAGDQARLLTDPILTETASEEDLALGRLLIDHAGPDAVAAALIRLHRAKLPAPEELFDPGEPRAAGAGRDRERRDDRQRPDRPPREGREPYARGESDGVWFRLPIGRNSNADPKWLVPMLCRRGHVTKKDIGQIRIFDRETKFEIARDAVDRFKAAVAAAPGEPIRIEPAGAPGQRPAPVDGEPRRSRKGPPPKRKANDGR